jgi:hypothetical protein
MLPMNPPIEQEVSIHFSASLPVPTIVCGIEQGRGRNSVALHCVPTYVQCCRDFVGGQGLSAVLLHRLHTLHKCGYDGDLDPALRLHCLSIRLHCLCINAISLSIKLHWCCGCCDSSIAAPAMYIRQTARFLKGLFEIRFRALYLSPTHVGPLALHRVR